MDKEKKEEFTDQDQSPDVKIEKSEIIIPDPDKSDSKEKKKKEPADSGIRYRSYKVSRRMGTKE